jgi:hypothetical protein
LRVWETKLEALLSDGAFRTVAIFFLLACRY